MDTPFRTVSQALADAKSVAAQIGRDFARLRELIDLSGDRSLDEEVEMHCLMEKIRARLDSLAATELLDAR